MGKKQIWHCHPSTKLLAHFHHVVLLKTKVLHFKLENTSIKDTNGKRKFKECSHSFLWTIESFSLWNCLSRNLNLFSSRRILVLGLFWTNRGSEISEETWGTFCTLCSRKVRFRFHGRFLDYCWFSHDVTKTQTKKLLILPRFHFHDVLEQLKTNFHTSFRFKRVHGFVIEYAWISKLLRDAASTWRPRELSCRLKKWLLSGNFAI